MLSLCPTSALAWAVWEVLGISPLWTCNRVIGRLAWPSLSFQKWHSSPNMDSMSTPRCRLRFVQHPAPFSGAWSSSSGACSDLIILGKTPAENLDNLNKVLGLLRGAGLKLKPSKCHILQREVLFLQHVVSQDGMRVNP